jgi:protein gp37
MNWWEKSWNPVVGCTPVSPGCDNCYAKALHDQRHKALLAGKDVPDCYARPFEAVRCLDERLMMPLRWREPQRVFVNSMSDLFHPAVPFEFLDRVFAVMALSRQHTFMILTKRPERMLEYVSRLWTVGWKRRLMLALPEHLQAHPSLSTCRNPINNVWLGVTAENQEQADARIPVLLDTPAAKRFVSVEPMLGPVDLNRIGGDALGPWPALAEVLSIGGYERPALDWIICGGETGPNARPMHPDWARSLRDQCAAAGAPFFFKQWGEWAKGRADIQRAPCVVIYPDGRSCEDTFEAVRAEADRSGIPHDYESAVIMSRIGSRRAGRLLDGREHNEIPSGGAS